jgi:hypothetical protein
MQKMPIMLNLHLFYILFQKLATLDKKFATIYPKETHSL